MATDAEQTGNTFAAICHLDRLLTLRPNDWTLLARRARMHVQADQLVEASADNDHVQRSGGNRVTHWYQHQAADARLAQRWSQVSWYLDRIQQETPNDWMVYRDRADVLAKLDKPDESKTALEKAVELGADPPTVLRLVELLARQSQWDRTAQLLGQLEARGVLSLGVAHLHALACLRTDDAPGYRRVCAALLTAVQGRRVPPPTANGIAWLCALGPSAVEDYASAIVLAEQAVAETPEAEKHLVLNTLGAVLYRAGRYQDAARYLNESIAAGGGKGVPQDWLFLAMTLHQLGNSAEAKKWLTQALAAPLEKGDDKFWDNVETELLRREGERLIDGK